jgi:murein DD-endopeptidase MepM/ murein hydrolase activator NlpD
MKNIVIALSVTLLVVFAIEYLFNYRLDKLFVVGLYLSLYGWLVLNQSFFIPEEISDEIPPDRSNWPLSGPFRILGNKGGAFLFMMLFWATNLLSFLNPFQFLQIVRQLSNNNQLKERERMTGDNGTAYLNKTNYCLPFYGEWLVFNGGITPNTSHSWDILGQRFALDFVQVDEGFLRHTGRGTRLSDYYCYGQDILAASAGKVIRIENNISDAPFVGFGICDFTARSFIGNHIIIQHADGEYGLYAHLIKGSITVKPGNMVERGQVIGQCGHSGHSSEPHLHFHLQDSPEILKGMGLPVRFSAVEIDGKTISNCHVEAGQRVRNICPEIDESSLSETQNHTKSRE